MSVSEQGVYPGLAFHTRTLTWDTSGLLTGIKFFTPVVGDVILTLGWISVGTAWNGTTPKLLLLQEGFANDAAALAAAETLAVADAAAGTGLKPARQTWPAVKFVVTDTTPLVLRVSDGANGDAGATQGEATIVLCVAARRSREPW